VTKAPPNATTAYILDPTGVVAERHLRAAGRPADLHGRVVGLLSNGVGATPEVLDALGDLLVARYGVRDLVKRQRPSLSRPTPAPMIEALVRDCDVVIAGCGF
jgi:hypothetical protein